MFIPLYYLGYWIQFGLILLSILVGWLICELAVKDDHSADPGWVVWDEMAATWLLLFLTNGPWYWYLVAILLFRLFDIMKPWPISWFDQNIKGGKGIMLDDLVAICPAWILVICMQSLLAL